MPAAPPRPSETDRNLLFGVLCLQADLIDTSPFAEICTAWASRKEKSLADLVLERGWIALEDKAHIDYLLARKLHKHGDAHASLVAAAAGSARGPHGLT